MPVPPGPKLEYLCLVTVRERIDEHRQLLTAAERRVAEVVLKRPQAVAFGTVAELARLSGTSGATIVRFANKLGFDGYIGLQDTVQAEFADELRPAAERIRQRAPDDIPAQALARELENVEATLHGIDRTAFAEAVSWLSNLDSSVLLCAGDCASGLGMLVLDQLIALRPGVSLIDGNAVNMGRRIALIRPDDVVLAIDFNRYDQWLLTAARLARERGGRLIALTDRRLGALARLAHQVFVVSAAGIGPFDSQVGTLALLNALVGAVATNLRDDASTRLGQVEQTWREMRALSKDD